MNNGLSGLLTFWGRRWDDILELVGQHLAVVALSVVLATVIGVVIGMLVWNRPVPRSLSITAAGIALTIPSLALLSLLTPIFGLGWTPTVFSLVFYSLLPIVRNTVVGLREVSPAIMEAAKGMGLSPLRVLLTVQLPIAWPIILTGIRVAAQLTIGIAAIAAYVAGPGLGQFIFQGLSSLGSLNALNFALTGTLGVVALALVIDALFILVTRVTTSRGLRV
ncbi:ABC transporter permease [Schumannella luteola]|uniref:Osmoprotectant transport system permease protein n=1 Tax=Schumannella luteola TaxID=472059 RepID=A0A852YN24_9MICO|nr:osmoprotectant transport system permease protein [Schumannella luteola]TPX04966.1 ABC transporter permease [Schumannella luteola]